MKVKVSDLVAETLEELGITHAFGIIGAGNIHLFEAIARRGFTEIICVHHEQAATMAMQTYFRTSGKIAACLLTTGGGSTNGVTGVVSAWMDSMPGLILAGNENSKFTTDTNPLRIWGVQGYDSVAMVEKVTKYAARTMAPETVAGEVKKAAHIALDGRPGPVWLEIPMNVQAAQIEREAVTPFVAPQTLSAVAGLETRVAGVLERLRAAERPVLWLGSGIRLAGGVAKLPELLDKLGIPALLSWAGADMVASDHPLVMGRAGVYGQRAANFVLQNSDYVLNIGNRMAIPQIGYDLSELARGAKIDVVDIEEREATKHQARINEAIVCDALVFMTALIEAVDNFSIGSKTEWLARCESYREEFPWIGPEHDDQEGYMNSYRFMRKLNEIMKPDQVVVTDMGTALLCGYQTLRLKDGQRLMTSTGLGEMGFGLPGAIGASFARDRGEIMCLNCDGGMMMNLQELQTMVHHQLPIKLFIFNNDGYLMIKHTQKALFKSRGHGIDAKTGVSCPDFSKLAAAFDIPAFQIRQWDECDAVLEQVQAATGPVVCEVFMHPEQLFVPKLSLATGDDGTLVSPPLEDLSPLVSRETLERVMIVGMHEKSRHLG
ncbi:MAG: thiamine pyrophosphate-binding protein [Rhodocyclaceae bacterium]